MQPNQNGDEVPDQQTDATPSTAGVDAGLDNDLPQTQPDDHKPDFIEVISWEASEFVHREKNMMWFVGVVIAGVILLGLSIWLQAWTFTVLIVVMVAAIFFMAVRPPRVLHYQLSGSGLSIGENHYAFRDFRAFGIVREDALYYITLIPVKRFMPAIDVYFPQEHGEQIVDAFGGQIPMQTVKPDFIDNLMHKLRF